jgi:uncharacterized membrane protein YccC
MDWEKPYWAGFAVAFISLDTTGASLNKAAMRMMGTLVAILAAFTFLSLFPQQRWLFTAVVSLYVGLCAYMMTGSKHQYFWYASGFICLVISIHSSNSLTAFQIAVERAQETGTGILVYSLVSMLLWPRGSRGVLEDTSRKLWATQARLYRICRGLMSGKGTGEDSRPLRLQEVQLLTRAGQLLDAAETDSYEVWEVRHQWRYFHQLSTTLRETLDRWRESFPQIRDLDLTKPLPNLDSLSAEIDRRFAEIEHMLAGQAPAHLPEAITLKIDRTAIRTFGHFQKAAIAVVKTQLDRLEAISRALFDCVRDLKGFGGPALKPSRAKIPRRGHTIDPDRFQGAITVMATLWIAFFIWVYVDPPGHASFVQMSTTFTMVAVRTGMSTTAMPLPLILGTLFAGILYIFVMPHLSGYGQLGLMIFVVTFGITYLFSAPRQAGVKLIALAMFASHISVQNQQHYSFVSFINGLAMICLVSALIIATAYIPPSPRPEKAFLRLLRRFFRHAELLMSRPDLDQDKQNGLPIRWRMAFYRADLREIPAKLAVLGQRIDTHLLSGQKPDKIQALVASLQALSYRIQDLLEAGPLPQSQLLVRELQKDVITWRTALQEIFGEFSKKPERAVAATLRSRLNAMLRRLEACIEEAFNKAQDGVISEKESKNLYRLLGAHRGMSEALVDFAGQVGRIRWARLREERF